MAATLGFIAYLIRVADFVVRGHAVWVLKEDMVAHLAAVCVILVPWAVCRGGPRSRRFVTNVDSAGLVAASLCWCWMGSATSFFGINFIVLLAMTYNAFTRAILVPSSAKKTLVLTSLCGLGFLLFLRPTPEQYFIDLPAHPVGSRVPEVVISLIWWAFSTAVATSASDVIYGLREQVSAARRVGQYTLEERIGEGAMGIVYRAQHSRLRRPTAIKLLPPARAGVRAIARFEREVQLTATLTHPNTITVFDYGRTPDGTFYYAMELLDGESLEDIVGALGPLPAARVVHLLRQAAGALGEAHDAGLVHRDVKPSNLVLCRRGGVPDVVKVLDFGIVRDRSEVARISGDQSGLLGTPQYLSPEAISSPSTVGPASDLYALGAVGYYLLTGRPVFEAPTVVEVCSLHLTAAPTPPSLRVPDVPPGLEAVLLNCLAKKPGERPASARALLDALAQTDSRGWSEADAEDWWREHGVTVRAARAKRLATHARASGTETLAIDPAG